ncbi:MAG: hypothetical protein AAGH89_18540, partial [Verrucomicrobiota bacterium]
QPYRGYFRKSSHEAASSGVTKRDFVLFAEASEAANPEAFAERLGFYFGIIISEWTRVLSPALVYNRPSTEVNWDKDASVFTLTGVVSRAEGGEAMLQLHWIVADGATVGIGAFAERGAPDSEEFLRQVSDMAHSAIIRDENRLAENRLLELGDILAAQWEKMRKHGGFKDEYEIANSNWNSVKNTPEGIELAEQGLAFARSQEKAYKGLWLEDQWRRKRLRAKIQLAYSTAVSVDQEEGLALAREAVSQARQALQSNRTPESFDSLASVIGIYRDLLRFLKYPKSDQLAQQEAVIQIHTRARRISDKPDILLKLSNSNRLAAMYAREGKELDRALAYIHEAERLIVQEFHPGVPPSRQRWRELRDIHNLRADILKDQKDLQGAIQASLKALDAAEKQRDIRPAQTSLHELVSGQLWKVANLCRQANHWKADHLAIDYGQKSIDVYNDLEKAGKLSEAKMRDRENRLNIMDGWERERSEQQGS